MSGGTVLVRLWGGPARGLRCGSVMAEADRVGVNGAHESEKLSGEKQPGYGLAPMSECVREDAEETDCDTPQRMQGMTKIKDASKQAAPHRQPFAAICETIVVEHAPARRADSPRRVLRATSLEHVWLHGMRADAMFGQVDGVHFRKWEQKRQKPWPMVSIQSDRRCERPRGCAQGGVAATGNCGHGKCLQCAVQKASIGARCCRMQKE